MLRSVINKNKNNRSTYNTNQNSENVNNSDNGIYIKNEYGARKVVPKASSPGNLSRSVHRTNKYYISGVRESINHNSFYPNCNSCTDSSCYYCRSRLTESRSCTCGSSNSESCSCGFYSSSSNSSTSSSNPSSTSNSSSSSTSSNSSSTSSSSNSSSTSSSSNSNPSTFSSISSTNPSTFSSISSPSSKFSTSTNSSSKSSASNPTTANSSANSDSNSSYNTNSNCGCQSTSNSSNSQTTNSQTSTNSSSSQSSSDSTHNPTSPCFAITSRINLSNNRFIYGIANTSVNNKELSLIQFNGNVHIPDVNPDVNSDVNTVMYLTNSDLNNPDGLIDSSHLLWHYNGLREDQQYAQILRLDDDIITLSSYTGTITMTNNLLPPSTVTLNSNNGNYFLARFNTSSSGGTARMLWNVPISALGNQNVEMTKDDNGNIYLIGTYQGTARIGNTTLTSNLINDMFIAKIDENGNLVWLKSSSKNDAPVSTGFIRGESIVAADNTITAIGQYSSTLNIQDISVTNQSNASYILWIAQFNPNGDVIWLTSVIPNPNNTQRNYVDGSQIIAASEDSTSPALYITGIALGDFGFGSGNINSNQNVIYVARMSMDGQFTGLNYAIANIPNGSNWDPHIIYNSKLFISFFALGNVMFNGNELPLMGTGTQNMVINALNEEGLWDCGYQIQGLISNPSINTSTSGTGISVVGTHIINMSNTDAVMFKLTELN